MAFWVQDANDPRGYSAANFPLNRVPRNHRPWAVTAQAPGAAYVPGAINALARGDGHVVYCPQNLVQTPVPANLRAYDATENLDRRLLMQSLLAVEVVNNPMYTAAAVNRVGQGVLAHLRALGNSQRRKDIVVGKIESYFFTNGGMGFGRINTAPPILIGTNTKWQMILNALLLGRVDQKLSIHDAVGRKILNVPAPNGTPANTRDQMLNINPPLRDVYLEWQHLVRRGWFNVGEERGRRRRQLPGPATPAGGVVPAQHPVVPPVAIPRNRTVDRMERDLGRRRNAEADYYYDRVDALNLGFVGGISGSTGTLLQAAHAFGGINGGELLKQYTLAIVGYLVGGGMHSYHECMVIAQKVGVPYVSGKYSFALPRSMTTSFFYRNLSDQYYDVIVLGDRHGRLVNHIPTFQRPHANVGHGLTPRNFLRPNNNLVQGVPGAPVMLYG